jgi:hypothetical protein
MQCKGCSGLPRLSVLKTKTKEGDIDEYFVKRVRSLSQIKVSFNHLRTCAYANQDARGWDENMLDYISKKFSIAETTAKTSSSSTTSSVQVPESLPFGNSQNLEHLVIYPNEPITLESPQVLLYNLTSRKWEIVRESEIDPPGKDCLHPLHELVARHQSAEASPMRPVSKKRSVDSSGGVET